MIDSDLQQEDCDKSLVIEDIDDNDYEDSEISTVFKRIEETANSNNLSNSDQI